MAVPLDEQQSSISPAQIVAILKRRRWLILLSTFVGWAVVAGVGWLLPPKFKSETTILVQQQKVPEHYVVPNVSVDLQQRLQSLTQQILSRTRLADIITRFGLYRDERNGKDMDSLVERMRKDIDIELVRSARQDELSAFKISYSASNPATAQQIAGELTSLFIDENLRNREQLSEQTTAFLDNQLEQAKKSLDQQEQRVREFKSKYLGELPEQMNSNLTILNGLQGRLQSTNDALNQAEQQRLYLQSLEEQYKTLSMQTTQPADSHTGPVSIPLLNQRLMQLRAQLADYSSRYTPQHPDILRLKTEIANTEKMKQQMEAELAAHKASAKNDSANTATVAASVQPGSPIAQLQAQLQENDFEISRLKRAVHTLDGQIEDYQHRLNLAPVTEQEFAAITRDHEESEKNYESLLAKKLQSQMATNLERRQQGETFEVLDAPNLPQKPYWPKRIMFGLGGVGAGLALGLGLTLLLEGIGPRVNCEAELKSLSDMPLLVSVPRLQTPEEKRNLKFRLMAESVVASILVMAIAAGNLLIFLKS